MLVKFLISFFYFEKTMESTEKNLLKISVNSVISVVNALLLVD